MKIIATRADAEAIVAALLVGEPGPPHLLVNTSATMERPWGWVVSPCTAEFLESRSFKDVIVGLGPYLVARDGRVFACGSVTDFEHWSARLERRYGLASVVWLACVGMFKARPYPVPEEVLNEARNRRVAAPYR